LTHQQRDTNARLIEKIMEKRFFPLSSITTRISELLQPAITKRFWVKAEVMSGRERGGAFYCDLIETAANGKIAAKISCTIWTQELNSIRNLFKSKGMELVLTDGTVVGFQCTLQYSPQYGISLRVIDADPSIALGEMELKKREIIERLQKEGLFTPNKECAVPLLPLKIGLISSSGSAAYNDFIQTLSASGYGFKLYMADAMMQGDQTEKSVLRSIDALHKLKVELIVIARGGGSKTDLYFLDNEAIARKIANSTIPVWTGIGHEIDTSVLDFVANKSFKTPTAAAEDLVARFVQMRRQLDESANTLQTVWAYRYKIDRDYLGRAITGIHQGPRKLLEVTSSSLRERAQDLRHRVSGRLSTEHILIEGKRGQLKSLPISIIQKHIERLTVKGSSLGAQVKFALSSSTSTIAGLKSRFDRNRFIKRLQLERDVSDKSRQQLIKRFGAILKLKTMQQGNRKERFRVEKIKQRVDMERKSLNDKMATLRAIDPQNALQRGFALVYRSDGNLIRSIQDIAEKDIIYTRVADGSLVSEVTAKESKRD
jgi:exodeoxyribonuclease VII large subunit